MVMHPEYQISHFREALDSLNLVEIFMNHTNYTWWNKRSGENVVWEKLDRCFGNASFRQKQQYNHVITLLMVSSDYHALKLVLKKCNEEAL